MDLLSEIENVSIIIDTVRWQRVITEIKRMKKENELLKEELTNLKNDITRVYNTMISLETINKQEMEEVDEL